MEDVKVEFKAKEEEMKEKYKDVIDNLLEKYGGTTDRGFEYLKGLARGFIFNEEQIYFPDVEYNKEELIEDEKILLNLAEKVIVL